MERERAESSRMVRAWLRGTQCGTLAGGIGKVFPGRVNTERDYVLIPNHIKAGGREMEETLTLSAQGPNCLYLAQRIREGMSSPADSVTLRSENLHAVPNGYECVPPSPMQRANLRLASPIWNNDLGGRLVALCSPPWRLHACSAGKEGEVVPPLR